MPFRPLSINEEVVMDRRHNYLIYLAIKYRGDWDRIYLACRTKEEYDTAEINTVVNQVLSKCNAMTMLDEDYPPFLKQVRNPPIVLFYIGDKSLLYHFPYSLAVVGTRNPSSRGKEITREIVDGLPSNIIIVSGMASGIDTVAHQSAIASGHKTIAVLGCGFNYCYPSDNWDLYDMLKREYLVVSEYPPDEGPRQSYFPARNRIISGLTSKCLVTEASLRSGTMITATFSLESGKDVMCVPSENYGDSACNLLLKEGAALVENADDVAFIFRDAKYYNG